MLPSILLVASLGATSAEQACTPPTYAHASPPKYPPSAVAERLEGLVVLRVKVGSDGTVKESVVESSSGHAVLDEAVKAAAAHWTFNPMRCEGKPSESYAMVPFRFDLDDLPLEPYVAPAASADSSALSDRTETSAVTPLRRATHVVAPDTETMGFSTFAEGERALARMGLEKRESSGLAFHFGVRDLSRTWIVYRRPLKPGNAIVRLRSTTEEGRAVHRYSVLCEGPDAWCRQLREDTEAQLRTNPPPIPPPPPAPSR